MDPTASVATSTPTMSPASRTPRDQLRADLVQRGLHKQTAEEYIALVEKTLFNRG